MLLFWVIRLLICNYGFVILNAFNFWSHTLCRLVVSDWHVWFINKFSQEYFSYKLTIHPKCLILYEILFYFNLQFFNTGHWSWNMQILTVRHIGIEPSLPRRTVIDRVALQAIPSLRWISSFLLSIILVFQLCQFSKTIIILIKTLNVS